jgi:glutaredoxin-dependent peroxiredoxin
LLDVGDPIPEAQVWLAPREGLSLRDLVEEGPILVLLRDRSKDFEEAGVRAMAASRDSPWSHVAWMQALDLNFPLLSDWNGEAIRGFGIAREYRGMQDVARRSAFLIDADGTVRGAWAFEDAELPDFDEFLSAARAL